MTLGVVPDSEGDAFLWHPIGLLSDKEASPRHIGICTSCLTWGTGSIYPWSQTVLSALLKHKWLFPVGDN